VVHAQLLVSRSLGYLLDLAQCVGNYLGSAGGWLQGGGHGPLTPNYGMGVDRVLQFKVSDVGHVNQDDLTSRDPPRSSLPTVSYAMQMPAKIQIYSMLLEVEVEVCLSPDVVFFSLKPISCRNLGGST